MTPSAMLSKDRSQASNRNMAANRDTVLRHLPRLAAFGQHTCCFELAAVADPTALPSQGPLQKSVRSCRSLKKYTGPAQKHRCSLSGLSGHMV